MWKENFLKSGHVLVFIFSGGLWALMEFFFFFALTNLEHFQNNRWMVNGKIVLFKMAS